MSKFKVGDRVRALESCSHNHITEGKIYEVLDYHQEFFDDDMISVKIDNGNIRKRYVRRFVLESENSETVKTSVKATITLKINLGGYVDTYELSREEARQLLEQLKKELEV